MVSLPGVAVEVVDLLSLSDSGLIEGNSPNSGGKLFFPTPAAPPLAAMAGCALSTETGASMDALCGPEADSS
jgi:hypothetical protein